MSIRLRLTLWYSALLTVTLCIFSLSIYLFVNYNSYRDVKTEIQDQLRQMRIVSSLNYFNGLNLDFDNQFESNVYIQVKNYTNGDVAKSDNLKRANKQFAVPDPNQNIKEGYVTLKLDQYEFLAYQQPLRLKQNNQIVGLLQIAVFTSPIDNYMKNLRTILIFASFGVIVIAFTIGLFLARKSLRPIENVIRAAKSIQNESDLSMRIPIAGPNDEIGRLTDTLNGMLGRIETTYNELDDAYKAQRRFVSDASHELRTPLTTIRGNIELLERMWPPMLEAGAAGASGLDDSGLSRDGYTSQSDQNRMTMTREAMHDIAGEAKRMSNLVNDLLALARADAGYEMEKTTQPLLPLVEDVARRAQLLPRNADWKIGNLSAIENVQVNAHADFLRQLLFIFVENAFKYTPSGYVEMRAARSQDQAGIIIKDTGIGMNNKEVPHIFERFYRADESRGETSGTGLGLSIAKWIIDEHGGSVEVSTREGEGTTFTVWLPIAFLGSANEV
ncbi:sensor histidine kinase [Paenibacillus sacheonensis]|uniref:histidine kinase n=1 Tax=Paenibacillus sacheonensis TaxID=742054 RepID=A0A7X4YNP2_9BACL|nr:HAMP domain-containing sensor histidine kinase [Paenibacillus sacheonensis]MBM7565344.1 signal transduction histidine kinase [Paenibacillus sacheonensis]NBC69725.1 HAMP domain-containing protein [Paenibacillus sacheonensis]